MSAFSRFDKAIVDVVVMETDQQAETVEQDTGKSGWALLRIILAIPILLACLAIIAIAAVTLLGTSVEPGEIGSRSPIDADAEPHEYVSFAADDVDPEGRARFEDARTNDRQKLLAEIAEGSDIPLADAECLLDNVDFWAVMELGSGEREPDLALAEHTQAGIAHCGLSVDGLTSE